MELVNELYAFTEGTHTGAPGRRVSETAVVEAERIETVAVVKEAVEALVLMLSPFAPHTAEELWAFLGHADGLAAARLAGVRSAGGEGRRRSSCPCR